MKVYLLNALITPFTARDEILTVFAMQKITKDRYEEILRQILEKNIKIVSAIGFHDTVKFLKETLSPDLAELVRYNRDPVFLEAGDMALVFRIAERGKALKEWKISDIRRMHKAKKTEFFLLSRIYAPEVIFDPVRLMAAGRGK
jgi:hypothetical protein